MAVHKRNRMLPTLTKQNRKETRRLERIAMATMPAVEHHQIDWIQSRTKQDRRYGAKGNDSSREPIFTSG
jgi:hypothetical protein